MSSRKGVIPADEEAEDDDQEYELRRSMLLAKLPSPQDADAQLAVRTRDALAEMLASVVQPVRRQTTARAGAAPLLTAPVAARVQHLLKFEHAEASVRMLHTVLARPTLGGGSAFQQRMARAAARPPWPPALAVTATSAVQGLSVREAMDALEREFGASLVVVYAWPAERATVLVLEWQTEEVSSTDGVALAVVFQQALPPPDATAAAGAIYTREEMVDVDVQWPLGVQAAQAAEDRVSDRGACAVWRTPLFYEQCAFVRAQLAFVSVM